MYRLKQLVLMLSTFSFSLVASATVFVVNSPLDAPDADPGDGLAQTAGGATILRAVVIC